MRQILLCITLFISFAAASNTRALTLLPKVEGEAVVATGIAYTYSYSGFAIAPMWELQSGTATLNSTWSSGGVHYASITFTTSAVVVFFDEVQGAYSTKAVSVVSPPTAPNVSICGAGTVTLTATPGAGGAKVRWYAAATGGAALGTSNTYELYATSSTTYYVETWYPDYSMASSRVPVSITVDTIPAAPISVTNATRCGQGSVTLSAVPSTDANSILWYSSPTGGDTVHVGLTFSTPTLWSLTGYYASSFNNVTGCSSTGRVEVLGEVFANPPPLVAWGNKIRYGSGQTDLNATGYTTDKHGEPLNLEIDTDVYDIFWYASQTNAENDASRLANTLVYTTPMLTATTTYYARLRDEETGCYSNVAPVTAEVVPYVTNASIRTDRIRVTGKKTEASLSTLTDAEKTTTFAYLDGVGRVQQSVVLRGSPTGKDIVIPAEYDATGRVAKQYLAYAANTANGSFHSGYKAEQQNFFLALNDKIADDSAAYVKTIYEESPLGKVLEQGSAGKAFQPGTTHTTRAEYAFNSTNEVRRFDKKGNSTDFYPAKTLTRVKSTSGQNNHTVTFIDGAGRTVLTRQQIAATVEGVYTDYLETHYLYDDLGHLTYIISPKGVAELKANSWNFAQAIKDSYCNQFKYDNKGRVTQKKVPGQAWQSIVYDPLGRIVLTQDGLLKLENKWIFIKYDYKGHAVMSGIHTNTTYTTRATMQAYADGIYASGHATFGTDTWYEMQGTTAHGHTNVSFPKDDIEVLAVNYVDDYDFDNNGTADAAYVTESLSGEHTPAPYTLGKPTGSKRKILETGTWLYTYVFYDDRGRAIQVQRTNPLNTSSLDRVTNVYADDGRVLYSKKYHGPGTPGVVQVLNTYDYHSDGRLSGVKQKNNTDAEKLLVQYEYNELGQVVDKKLHHTGGGNFLQSVDYRYTIRGQLKSINNSELSSNGSNDDPDSDRDDYFGMEMLYNETESGLSTTAKYDGNLSGMKWKSVGAESGSAGQKSYAYAYDKTGRLETASFAKKETTWNKETGAQDEAITYDFNGNIKSLTRKQRKYELSGVTASYTSETIDDLTYSYKTSDANNLAKVTDASLAAGFDNGNSSTNNDYTYDINGNLTSDKNKGIDSIYYNFLGKPVRMDFSDGKRIEYVYDAGGNKLTQKLYNGSTLITKTDYANGFVYENDTLSFFGSPEGRVVNNSGTLQYEYAIADHQGNTRVVFTSEVPATEAAIADFESSTNDDFQNYGNRVNFELMDHTDFSGSTYSYSQKLTGGANSQVGVSKSMKVYPGDKVKIEAYAKYYNPSGSASNITGFAAALTSAFGVSSISTGEALKAYTALNDYGGFIAAGGPDGTDEDYPKLFVNILLFDKDHNFLDAAWEQIDGGEQVGATPKAAHDYMSKEVTVKEAGFAYVFVSNENPTLVEFYVDDVSITHTPTNVIQYSDYYPFGLMANTSWTRENTKDNNYLYNAANELNKTSGWYEMFYRGYDPAIGRMLQVDPFATMYASKTTYNYALNNPVMMNDPSGGQAKAPPGVSESSWNRIQRNSNRNNPNYFSDWAYDFATDRMDIYLDAEAVRNGGMSMDAYVSKYEGGRDQAGQMYADMVGGKYEQGGYFLVNHWYRDENGNPTVDSNGASALGIFFYIDPSKGSNWASSAIDWAAEHFEISLSFEESYGFQGGGGWKKAAAAYVDFGSTVRTDFKISNKGATGGRYNPGDKENSGFGVSYEGVGIDFKRQVFNGVATNTVSVGVLGFLAVERTFNDQGEMVDWFWGVDLAAKSAAGMGIEAGFRFGFSK